MKDNANITLFIADIGKYIQNFDHNALKIVIEACKFAKAKRECCEAMAKYLPPETSNEQKEEIAALISAAFERNKARKAFGLE